MKDLRFYPPIFLLILIILVLLLTSCKGIVPSPGATDDLTIYGQIKMPVACCVPLEEKEMSKSDYDETEFWGIVPDAVVELKNAGNCQIVDTTESDETGYYVFDDIQPGLYIVTAYCPSNEKYLLKDVAEKAAGVGLDAGIPDCESTALALVIEYLEDCYDENYFCFNQWSRIYKLVQAIAEDVGEVNIPAIQAHEDFGVLDDFDYDDLVDQVCEKLEGCCISPGTTPSPGPGPTPTPTTYILTLLVSPEGAGTVTGAGTYSVNATANISASTNAGWQFVNWTGDATGSVSDTTVLMNGNKIATANFQQIPVNTFTITYHANGGTGSQNDPSSPYVAGVSVTALGQGSIVRSGFTFTGWNTAANGSGTAYAPDDNFSMPAANVTLYAQWTANPTYNVYYCGTSNTGGTDPIDSNNYEEGDPVTVLGSGSLTKTGFTFTGWNTAANGSGTAYAPDDTFNMPDHNVTLYAQWDQNCYSLTVNIVGSGSVDKNPDEDCYAYGTDVILTPQPNQCWYFDGWSDDLSGNSDPETINMNDNKEVTAIFVASPTADITLTARYDLPGEPCTDTWLWWHAPCNHTSGRDYMEVDVEIINATSSLGSATIEVHYDNSKLDEVSGYDGNNDGIIVLNTSVKTSIRFKKWGPDSGSPNYNPTQDGTDWTDSANVQIYGTGTSLFDSDSHEYCLTYDSIQIQGDDNQIRGR